MEGFLTGTRKHPAYRSLLPYGVLLACLSLTACVGILSNRWSQKRAELRYQHRTDEIISMVTQRVRRDAVVLHGCEALFAATGGVTRSQWKIYVQRLQIQEVLPGIQGVGFSKYIRPSELPGHIREIRQEGFADYTVWPAGDRDEYTSIVYLEPFDERNQRAFGYDMFSEAVRRAAMERARDTGTVSMSGKVSLVQETEEDVQAGFLIYLPVYGKNFPPGLSPSDRTRERRAALKGYVYSPVRVKDLVRATFPSALTDVAFNIYDGTEITPSSLLYASALPAGLPDDGNEPSFAGQRTFDLFGHQWTFVFRALPSFSLAAETYLSDGIPIVGIIISLLAFLFVRAQENTRTQALSLAQEMTSALRESEERFRSVFEQGPLGIAIVGLDFRWVAVNARLCGMVGYTEDELSKLTFVDITHPDDIETDVEQAEKLARGEIPYYTMEKRYIRKNGGVIWISLTASIMRDDQGVALYYLSMIEDISERKQAEQKVRQSERTLRSLVDGNPESLFMIDTEGIVLAANEKIARRFGTSVSALMGASIYDFLPPDVASVRRKHAEEVIQTGKSVRFEDTRFGRIIDNHMQPIFDQKGKVISLAVLGIDITNLRLAEEVQRRLAKAIEQSAEIVFITDADGVIEYVNPATEKITGFSRSEIIGNTPRLFKSGEHDEAFYDEMWKTLQSGQIWSGRVINKKKDGTLYHEDASISPVRDASGTITNFVAVTRDITEHLELTRQLFQSQKMEAVGTLAGGVAHDFNNLLTVVLGYSELLLADTDEHSSSHEDLQKIHQAAPKGADLVQRLLAFSRKSEIRPQSLNLNHRIEQLQKMLTRTIPKMIEIQLNLSDPLSLVNADPTQMDQVLMNLAVNAKDAMPDGGKLTIETANVVLDDDYERTHLGAKPGAHVLLSVSDTGHGMDKETQDHIFEPFFTTKEAGKGTGLGLAMVYGIVTQHGGQIYCYSEHGHGTTFKIHLPAITEAWVAAENPATKAMHRGGTETILLVDDEEALRELGKRILERAGYTVLTATEGKDALRLYQSKGDSISLVILDLIMPEMGGKQCLEALIEIDPTVQILIASGFAANGRTKEALEAGAKGYLNKPYNVKEMLESVREVLDAD